MSKFLAQVKTPAGPEIPQPPNKCSVLGCHEDVAVLMVLASGPGSPRVRGWLSSKVVTAERRGDSTIYRQNPGYSFDSWIARCAHHYDEDVRRARREALPLKPPTITTGDAKAFLDHMRASLGRTRKEP